jgi:hypothetical protein
VQKFVVDHTQGRIGRGTVVQLFQDPEVVGALSQISYSKRCNSKYCDYNHSLHLLAIDCDRILSQAVVVVIVVVINAQASGTWRNSIHLLASQYHFTIDGVFSVFKTVHFRRGS